MTTQAQGKGKKKNKEVIKFSLDEFNQINAPHGHSVVNVKFTGLDWAATMADHDQQVAETQQIIVPTAPRAQRGPDIDLDSLPTEPPFRISLFNVPIAAEEKDITDRFFVGLNIQRVDIQKASTTVELATRDDMYEALCKDGSSIKGRTVNVCIYGQQPQNNYNQDRSYQSGGRYGGQSLADRYGDRSGSAGRPMRSGPGGSGGYGQRYENNYESRNNFGSRFGGGATESEPQEESTNWRARATIKSTSPPPSQQTPQPSASDEVENWRARPTVSADPPLAPAPTSTEPPFDRSGDYNSERDSYNSYNRAMGSAGGQGRFDRPGGPGNGGMGAGGYGQRYENRYNSRNNYRSRYGGPDSHSPAEPENWRVRSTNQSSTSPQPSQQQPQPTSSDEVENWRARPTVSADPPSAPTS